jgi:sugar-specific transcriptional regulator TrmB
VVLLSQENLKNALQHFGATEKESEVYIFLAKYGTLRTGQVAKQMKKNRGLVYHILSSLKQKGLVEATLESPTRFTAVPLERVIEAYVKAKQIEIALVEKTKEDLLEDWKRISQTEVDLPLEKFAVIEGSKKIYRKIAEMVENTQNSFLTASNVAGLARGEQFGVFDAAYNHSLKSKVKFRFLTELNRDNLSAFKFFKAEFNVGLNIKARNPDLGLPLFPKMAIRDNKEILLFISPRKDLPAKKEVCVYTNCGSIVQAFIGVFEDLWRNSADINDKIVEIESGKPTPKTVIIADEEIAKKTYYQTVSNAQEEIMLITSAKNLNQLNEKALPLEELSKRKVSVKIMAPITSENLQSAKELSDYCEVRHLAFSYLGTAIIDSKHLFQLKSSSSDQAGSVNEFSFKNTFYTTDLEYVKKTKNMLENVWDKAYTSSVAILNPLFRSQIGRTRGIGAPRDIEKLPERLLKAARRHGVASAISGSAIISPPSHLKIPEIYISALNFDKKSSLGEGEMLLINLWLKTPRGEAFVPVAIVTNASSEVVTEAKAKWAGTPAGQNVIKVKPEELRVWIEGKILFAGWTIPIPLLPPKYKLDPGCILFEGFGDEFHTTLLMPLPSGYIEGMEIDGFEAFTTFIAPSWKFSGPGTFGTVGKAVMIAAAPEKSKS